MQQQKRETHPRQRWIVNVPGRVERIYDCNYDVALRFAQDQWHPMATVRPWLLASDALRAEAEKAPITRVPAPYGVRAQMGNKPLVRTAAGVR